jgi:WD40 repeat protein
VQALALSPDGKLLAAACQGGRVPLWALEGGKAEPRRELAFGDPMVRSVAFSADGRALACCGNGPIRIWDVQTGKELLEGGLPQERGVLAVCFSPDGKTLAAGIYDGTARLWDVATGAPRARPLTHDGLVYAVQFSPDGRLVCTGSADGTARLWDASTGQPLGPPFVAAGEVHCAAFRPDGGEVLLSDGSRLVAVPTPRDAALSAERLGQWLRVTTGVALTDDADGEDRRLRVLDMTAWTESRRRLEELGGPP